MLKGYSIGEVFAGCLMAHLLGLLPESILNRSAALKPVSLEVSTITVRPEPSRKKQQNEIEF